MSQEELHGKSLCNYPTHDCALSSECLYIGYFSKFHCEEKSLKNPPNSSEPPLEWDDMAEMSVLS